MTNLGYIPEEPIAAIATALNPGAIGIVRTSGKGVIELFAKCFSRPNAILSAKGNTLVYGWILDENKNRIDEVMCGVYRAPKSFTGEDMVEVFCHGGVSVVNAVYQTLLKIGFRPAERGEYTFRSYINGKTDLTRAEAVREIIESKTGEARSRAAGRLSGNLFDEMEKIKQKIIDTLAAIEVEIEYPEDEENFSDSFDDSALREIRSSLFELVKSWKCEKLYQDGARVVLAGKTNAGKSSLFNALLKEERAIVSSIEGTTRDWLESWVSFSGIPARLFDTAGLRETSDVIEAQGVVRTKDLAKEADVILYLVDSVEGLKKEDEDFILSEKNIPLVLVWNKCDSPDSKSFPEEKKSLCTNFISLSAKKGNGVGELSECVKKILLSSTDSSLASSGLGSQRQRDSVAEALERVDHAIEVAGSDYALDAVVQDLEDALDSLGEVTGSVTPEDILSSVFANFCVGK